MFRLMIVVLVSMIFNGGQVEAEQNTTICLNMIVKNESKVIRRCLESITSIIDHWVIVDTGSTDGTQEIIRDFLRDVPGELYERKWVDFAHNRNEVLALSKGKGEYILFIDADEILEFDEGFKLPELTQDYYGIITKHSGCRYTRTQLVKANLNWTWIGVLHEYIASTEAKTFSTLMGVYTVYGFDGYRSQDPLKFKKDATILEDALKKEPTNSRYQFYLAQSYRDANEFELAILNYRKRIAMGGFDQEVFWSMLQIGLLQEAQKEPPKNFVRSYTEAYMYRQTRAEPLYRLAEFYRRSENYLAGYLCALQGMKIKYPTDQLMVEQWIYDYGLLFEYSICAYWVGEFLEAKRASNLLLSMETLDIERRQCVKRNLVWIDKKIEEQNRYDVIVAQEIASECCHSKFEGSDGEYAENSR